MNMKTARRLFPAFLLAIGLGGCNLNSKTNDAADMPVLIVADRAVEGCITLGEVSGFTRSSNYDQARFDAATQAKKLNATHMVVIREEPSGDGRTVAANAYRCFNPVGPFRYVAQ